MTQAIIRDISGVAAPDALDLWEPVIITGEQIAREAERLAARGSLGSSSTMWMLSISRIGALE